jgi:hypothetical protein
MVVANTLQTSIEWPCSTYSSGRWKNYMAVTWCETPFGKTITSLLCTL